MRNTGNFTSLELCSNFIRTLLELHWSARPSLQQPQSFHTSKLPLLSSPVAADPDSCSSLVWRCVAARLSLSSRLFVLAACRASKRGWDGTSARLLWNQDVFRRGRTDARLLGHTLMWKNKTNHKKRKRGCICLAWLANWSRFCSAEVSARWRLLNVYQYIWY